MPLAWVEPEVFMTHGDVTIYHTYKDDLLASGIRTYWFGTEFSCSETENTDDVFDVRELKTWKDAEGACWEKIKNAIRAAIDSKELPLVDSEQS